MPNNELIPGNRSHTATSSQKHRDPRLLPPAFTEHGKESWTEHRIPPGPTDNGCGIIVPAKVFCWRRFRALPGTAHD